MNSGHFIISLDFELYWGVADKRSLNNYGTHILKVWEIIPRLLDLFDHFEIKATFATVGFMFAKDWNELEKFLPKTYPAYTDTNLTPYTRMEELKKAEEKYLFAPELIETVHAHGHEISTHTCSHFYCLEQGANQDQFRADLQAALALARNRNIVLKSIVFPRNQYSNEYLKVCRELGIRAYRGNEPVWFHRTESQKKETHLKRGIRLLDSYVALSKHQIFTLKEHDPENIPSSRFLRPYSAKLAPLEPLKIHRIKRGMTAAARQRKNYHLWWHPHNFGSYTEENFRNLKKILKHYSNLKTQFGYQNKTMIQLAE